MRSSKPRSRGKPTRNRTPGNNLNRVFDSSGPEGKVRGTPQQIIDKYTQLARDATLGNDRVAAENFQQHAEHYTRLLGEAQRDAEARRIQQETQNRERQQREREEREARAERAQAAENGNANSNANANANTNAANDPADVVGGDDSGLVETPESKPKRRSPRTSRAKPVAGSSSDGKPPETPEAAE